MNRRTKRNLFNLVDFLQAIMVTAIAVTIVGGFMYGCMIWFAKVDCSNARQGLDFIERCEASPNCSLRASELDLKRVYTRLEIKSCPREST